MADQEVHERYSDRKKRSQRVDLTAIEQSMFHGDTKRMEDLMKEYRNIQKEKRTEIAIDQSALKPVNEHKNRSFPHLDLIPPLIQALLAQLSGFYLQFVIVQFILWADQVSVKLVVVVDRLSSFDGSALASCVSLALLSAPLLSICIDPIYNRECFLPGFIC